MADQALASGELPIASLIVGGETIVARASTSAPPDAVRRQRPGQGPQNDLFAAI
ncbi:MAG: hypothetical protein ABGY43_11630 [bacterium]